MADGDPSEPRSTLLGVAVSRVREEASRPDRAASAPPVALPIPNPAASPSVPPAGGPIPNPAAWSSQAPDSTPAPEPSGRMTAPMPRTTAPLPQQQPTTAAPSQQAIGPYAGPMPQADGTVGEGPIRVVCRRCQRTVWGWKLPFGVSCPLGPHHSHVNWFLVGVVASFWAAFVVVMISLIGIAAG